MAKYRYFIWFSPSLKVLQLVIVAVGNLDWHDFRDSFADADPLAYHL